MYLLWNEIAAIRGYLLNGIEVAEVSAITGLPRWQIREIADKMQKEQNKLLEKLEKGIE